MSQCRIFLHPPQNFSPSLEAAGCYCAYEGKVLFVQRQKFKSQGNKWGVPAGKLEKGEKPAHTVIREMEEEVGLKLEAEKLCYIRSLYISLVPTDYIFHMFYFELTELPSIHLDVSENQKARWVTVQEALQLPLVAAGKEALLYYKSYTHSTSRIGISAAPKPRA